MTDPTTHDEPDDPIERALKPFGWTCGPEFWDRYYTDTWVFHLANAIERQRRELDELLSAARDLLVALDEDLATGTGYERLQALQAQIDTAVRLRALVSDKEKTQ